MLESAGRCLLYNTDSIKRGFFIRKKIFMSDRNLIISEEKYKELEKELLELKTKKRAEVARRIRDAKDYGDITENSEYDEAKIQQAFIEGKIAEIEDTLKKAKILPKNNNSSEIAAGSRVTLKDGTGKTIQYSIVGPLESDPSSGKISIESPLGLAIVGKKKGEEVAVSFPSGKTSFKILKIE